MLSLFVLVCAWGGALCSGTARAQEGPTRLPEAEVRARVAEADALLTRGDAARAIGAYDALAEQLYQEYDAHLHQGNELATVGTFACRRGVARLQGEPFPTHLRQISGDLGDGFAAQPTDAARAKCASAAGLALADAADRASREVPTGLTPEELRARPALLEEARFRAAVWLSRARALHDAPAVRAAFDALPASARADFARLSTSAPVEAADANALAHEVALWRYAADPTAYVGCEVDVERRVSRGGMIHCHVDRLVSGPGFNDGSPHFVDYFVRGPRGVRYAGGAPHTPDFDCESGLVSSTRSWQALSAARDHLDGVLRVYREGSEDGPSVDMTVSADVCDLGQRRCVTYVLGRRRCEPDEATSARVCSEDWEVAARVSRGALTFRRVRGTLPTGASGAHLTTAINLATLAAPTTAAAPEPLVSTGPVASEQAHGARALGGACHAEVIDPRPPLNVRAEPDQASAVAGTLPNGTRVVPRGRSHGFTRVEAPVAGWIWARNLRRVCD